MTIETTEIEANSATANPVDVLVMGHYLETKWPQFLNWIDDYVGAESPSSKIDYSREDMRMAYSSGAASMVNEEDLKYAFIEFSKKNLETALQISTGVFIGLNVAYVDLFGDDGDGKKKIVIDGPDGQRKITIHAA